MKRVGRLGILLALFLTSACAKNSGRDQSIPRPPEAQARTESQAPSDNFSADWLPGSYRAGSGDNARHLTIEAVPGQKGIYALTLTCAQTDRVLRDLLWSPQNRGPDPFLHVLRNLEEKRDNRLMAATELLHSSPGLYVGGFAVTRRKEDQMYQVPEAGSGPFYTISAFVEPEAITLYFDWQEIRSDGALLLRGHQLPQTYKRELPLP